MNRSVILITVVALSLGGCARDDGSVRSPNLPDGYAAFKTYVRQFQFDYEPAETPVDLAKEVDSVVTGTIVSVQVGQSYAPAPDSEPTIATSVIEVKVDEVLAGDDSVVSDGSVYVEIPHPAFVGSGEPGPDGEGEPGEQTPFDHASFAGTVPHAYGIFFLHDRTGEPYLDTILDKGIGRPEGARITAPAVQGFLLEDGLGTLTSILEPFAAMPPAWHALESVEDVAEQVCAGLHGVCGES
jgi:hypothetical protein